MDLIRDDPYSWKVYTFGVLVVLFAFAGVVGALSPLSQLADEDMLNVTLKSDGSSVGSVDASVANTKSEMVTGLSNHDTLAVGKGMLFIHGETTERTYVMRDMNFSIDIVFLNSSCEITTIHSAEKPAPDETGEEPKYHYSGEAKYVLEVPNGYATERVGVGDAVKFEGGC
ncbi:DUF192 domain-containing protein [Haloarcula sp. H-GB5]|jgi:uncharacterized membrane protein (UPF0127 family)